MMTSIKIPYNFTADETHDGEDFIYEVDRDQYHEALLDALCSIIGGNRKTWKLAIENELIDPIAIDSDDEIQDYIQGIFYNEAYENYLECEAERRDPYGYRGLNEDDFH